MATRVISAVWLSSPFLCALLAIPAASADSFTLRGRFTRDDQAALFDVLVTSASSIQFRTYGYAGGHTATGSLVQPGGFDPVLTLFDSNGSFLADNDEGQDVPVDSASGKAEDALLEIRIQPGHYIVALTQYDNFSIGTLSDGFLEQGNPHFTSDPEFSQAGACLDNLFRDTSAGPGRCRNGNWTVDFLHVASVTERNVSPVPEPALLWMVLPAIMLFIAVRVLGLAVQQC